MDFFVIRESLKSFKLHQQAVGSKQRKSYNSSCNAQSRCKGYYYRIMWISKFYSGSNSSWTFLWKANELKAIRWKFHLGSKQSLSSMLTETTSQGSTTTHPPLPAIPGTCSCQTSCLIWLDNFLYSQGNCITQWSQQSSSAGIKSTE